MIKFCWIHWEFGNCSSCKCHKMLDQIMANVKEARKFIEEITKEEE